MYTKMLTPFLAPGGTMPGERVEQGEGVRKEGTWIGLLSHINTF
jgi:hypothetical protein